MTRPARGVPAKTNKFETRWILGDFLKNLIWHNLAISSITPHNQVNYHSDLLGRNLLVGVELAGEREHLWVERGGILKCPVIVVKVQVAAYDYQSIY